MDSHVDSRTDRRLKTCDDENDGYTTNQKGSTGTYFLLVA